MKKFNKHVIIVGSGRSGTSWLCELMAAPHRYRLLYEPEHETNTKNGHLLCDRFIEDTEDAGNAHKYLTKIFSNRIDCNWIAQNSNRKWKRHLWPFVPKRFIIKFVRCNLAANYMNKAFQIPVIHIIRNPYDVIESQQRVKFPWLFDLSHFEREDKLVKWVKEKYKFDLSEISQLSNVEKLALRWSIENIVALEIQKEKSPTYTVVKFEDLRNDKEIFNNICKEINFETTPNLDAAYEKPSSKAHARGLKGNKPKIEMLDGDELERITTILQIFNLNLYPLKEQ